MRADVYRDSFDFLDRQVWVDRDVDHAEGRQFAKGASSCASIGARPGAEGLDLSIRPTEVVDGVQHYGYGHIGAPGMIIRPGDDVHAKIRFAPGRGAHGSLWLQSKTPYVTPADYEADIEHMGAQNPWRKAGVNLHQAVHWKAAGQPWGQFTSVEVDDNSGPILGPRVPWSDDFHHYVIQVRRYGFRFVVDGHELHRINTALVPNLMFVCLSMISRDFEYEDLEQAFKTDPLRGPGVMTVQRLWVTRPVG